MCTYMCQPPAFPVPPPQWVWVIPAPSPLSPPSPPNGYGSLCSGNAICNAMPCNARRCNAMQCNAINQCAAMQCNALRCSAMQCNCNAMEFNHKHIP